MYKLGSDSADGPVSSKTVVKDPCSDIIGQYKMHLNDNSYNKTNQLLFVLLFFLSEQKPKNSVAMSIIQQACVTGSLALLQIVDMLL
jgi:hypothetical protein